MPLRYLQTLAEIGAERNSTALFPMPIDTIKPLLALFDKLSKARSVNGDCRAVVPSIENTLVAVLAGSA